MKGIGLIGWLIFSTIICILTITLAGLGYISLRLGSLILIVNLLSLAYAFIKCVLNVKRDKQVMTRRNFFIFMILLAVLIVIFLVLVIFNIPIIYHFIQGETGCPLCP